MKKSLEEKKAEAARLRLEIEMEEYRIKQEKQNEEFKKNGMYIPLATAVSKYNIWRKSERDFEEIGDEDWYTAEEILGTPDIKAGAKVVLIKTQDKYTYWFNEPESGDYSYIEEDGCGLDDNDENRESYLKNIVEL